MLSREYGAWAMLLLPYLIGLSLARNLNLESGLLLVALIALFSLNHTAKIHLRTRSSRALRWSILYSGVAAASGAPLLFLFKLDGLIVLGATAALPLLVHLYLFSKRLERTASGELLAIAGLTLAAPASLYTATSNLGLDAVILWLLVFLFFGESVFYVKMKVGDMRLKEPPKGLRDRLGRGKPTLAYYALLHSVVVSLVAMGFTPLPVILAYTPTTVKALEGIFVVRRNQPIKRVGFLQVGNALLFSALLPLLLPLPYWWL